MSQAENSNGAGFGTAEYDTNIVQLSDTEMDGVPLEQITERYDPEDVDAFIYAGDASKKTEDPESYVDQLEETYQDLSILQDQMDAEVLVLPGNNEPIEGAHTIEMEAYDGSRYDDSEFVEEVNSLIEDRYKWFFGHSENGFEFLVDEYDLTNLEYGSVKVGDLTVVGGTHHDGEIDIEKEWLDEMPEPEEVGYEEEQLEELAETIVENQGAVSKFLNTISFGYLGGPLELEADDLTLHDLPAWFEKTEKHEDYDKALEIFENLSKLIESARNDVYLAHHGVASTAESEYGSDVVDKLIEKYSDKIVGSGGGHSGEAGVEEVNGVKAVNTNGGAVMELGFENGELQHAEKMLEGPEPEPDQAGEAQPDQQEGSDTEDTAAEGEEDIQDLNDEQIAYRAMPYVMQAGGVDDFYDEVDGNLEPEAYSRLEEVRDELEQRYEFYRQQLQPDPNANGQQGAQAAA